GIEGSSLAKERPRRQHLPRKGMFYLAGGGSKDDLLAAGDRWRHARTFAADAGEVGGETVEIILAPDLEGMMMALRRFEANAEEQLADHRRDFRRLAPVAEHGHGTVAEGAALGRDDFTDELIVGLVLAERIA